jgi:hypothetical protein
MRKAALTAALVAVSATALAGVAVAPSANAAASKRADNVVYSQDLAGGSLSPSVTTSFTARYGSQPLRYGGNFAQVVKPNAKGLTVTQVIKSKPVTSVTRCSVGRTSGTCLRVTNKVTYTVKNSVDATWRVTDVVRTEVRRSGVTVSKVFKGKPAPLSSALKSVAGSGVAYDTVVNEESYTVTVNQAFKVKLNGISTPSFVAGSHTFGKTGSFGSDITSGDIVAQTPVVTVGACKSVASNGASCLFVKTTATGTAVTKYDNTWTQTGVLTTEVNNVGVSKTTLSLGTASLVPAV